MTKVVLGPDSRVTFPTLTEQLELCDTSGKTLGHYLPENDYRRLLYEKAAGMFDDEEIERRRLRPTTGRTLSDIWKRLNASCDTP